MNKKLIVMLLLLFSPMLTAGEMVYGFVNPDFGGSPLNGAPLLAVANAQNSFTSSHSTTPVGYVAPTANQSFQTNLNSQILSRLSTLIINKAFGTPGSTTNSQSLPAGTSIIGNYQVINDTANNSITVIDNTTGQVLVNLDLSTLQAP